MDRVIILHGSSPQERNAVADLDRMIPHSEIVETNSLEEYLAAIGKGEFDLVVLDYDLPEVQTKDLLNQLKLRDHEPEVLLLSACADQGTIRSIAKAQRRYVVREAGWIDEMALAIRDILRIRRLESEMALMKARLIEANQRLEARNQKLDDFCATIAHDVRGPLAGLILKVEYILETQSAKLDQRSVDLLKRSVEASRRLVGVVQAMYEFAKIGFSGAQFSEISLTPLVQEVARTVQADCSDEIRFNMQDLPIVWGSEALLRRVFQTLFANAIKYNHREKVEIKISFDGIVQRGTGEFVSVSVGDNGPGISPLDVGKVFNMFARGNGADRGSGGLGIGLAIVQRIVELHKGTIELTSQPHQGARFTMLLPTRELVGFDRHLS